MRPRAFTGPGLEAEILTASGYVGLRSLETLRYFTHLKTLILDNNALDVS